MNSWLSSRSIRTVTVRKDYWGGVSSVESRMNKYINDSNVTYYKMVKVYLSFDVFQLNRCRAFGVSEGEDVR